MSTYHVKNNIVPIYRATTKVMIESQQEQVIGLDSVLGGLGASDTLTINSEVEVLRSYGLLAKVVDELDLTSDPEFNKRLPSPTQKMEIWRTILRTFGLASSETSTPDAETISTETMLRLREAVKAQNISNTLVFNISVDSADRYKAALISRTLANLYIDNQLEVKYDASQRATRWLTKRVTELQAELETANAAVTDFRGATELTNRENLLAQELQLKDTRDRITQLHEMLNNNEAQLSRMEAAQTYAEKASSSSNARLQSMLSDIETSATQDYFDQLFSLQLDRLKTERVQTLKRTETLKAAVQKFEVQLDQMNGDLVRLEQLTRESEATRLLYEHFLTRLKETSAQEGIQRADSRILSAAIVPKFPASPNTKLIVTMFSILGMITGIAIVIIHRLTKVNILSHRELETLTGETVMGQIPLLKTKTYTDFLRFILANPSSPFVEAVRNLRTSLRLSNIDNEPRVIALTSAVPGEGKTSLCLALAQSISSIGKSCLLIDGDLRRKTMTKNTITKEDLGSGIIAVLNDEASLQDAVTYIEEIGCDILSVEHHDNVSNSTDIFASAAFDALVAQARETYDYVIIDTAPVLLVPDVRLIMQKTDAILVVVGWNLAKKQQVQDALQIFADFNQPVTGLVLNRINARAMKRMGYGYDYKEYGNNS